MKRAFIWIFALILPLAACAEPFEEGKHYTVISQVGTPEPEVREFFSFLCGHCYKFEPTVHKIAQGLPEGVPFNRSHVEFVGRQIGPHYSRAYAVAHVLGVEAKIVPAIFEQAQVKHKYAESFEDFKSVFVENGVDPKKFDGAVNSFPVNGMVAQMRQQTTESKITGVPSFVVNGKYRISMSNVESTAQFSQLIDYLLKKG